MFPTVAAGRTISGRRPTSLTLGDNARPRSTTRPSLGALPPAKLTPRSKPEFRAVRAPQFLVVDPVMQVVEDHDLAVVGMQSAHRLQDCCCSNGVPQTPQGSADSAATTRHRDKQRHSGTESGNRRKQHLARNQKESPRRMNRLSHLTEESFAAFLQRPPRTRFAFEREVHRTFCYPLRGSVRLKSRGERLEPTAPTMRACPNTALDSARLH